MIQNQTALGKANKNSDKIVDSLVEHFATAIKEKRQPSSDEVDAVITQMADSDESGKPFEDIIDNKRWYVEEKLLPLHAILIGAKTSKEGIALIIDSLYQEYLLEVLDEDGASTVIAEKHNLGW